MTQFGFYEVVRATDSRVTRELGIAGRVGAVLAKSEAEEGSDQPTWYVVDFDDGDSLSIPESELEATGEFRQRSDYYSGESIRVSQDGELLEVNLFDEGDGQAEGSAPSR